MPLFGKEKVSELTRFYREMLPAPGRTGNALRFALSAALTVLFLLILQAPTSNFTLVIFALVMLSHDTPYDCFKDGVTVLVFAALGAASALVPIIVTGNDPVWRVLGIAFFTFIATFIYRASTFPIGGIPFGIVAYMGTSIWERRMPAEKLLHLALWPLGALAVGVGCVVAVDYLLTNATPRRRSNRK